MRSRSTGLLIAIALALTACGNGSSVSQTEPVLTPSPELDRLVDDYFASWTDYESDRFFELVTEDYVFEWGAQSWGSRAKMTEIERYEFVNFRVDFTSDRLWSGDGPRFYMSQSHVNYTDSGFPGPDGNTTISVLEIVERGGQYRISRHNLFG